MEWLTAAQFALDDRIDEDARDAGVGPRRLEHLMMGFGPVLVDAPARDHAGTADLLALGTGEQSLGGFAQPDIDIKPQLVRPVARAHRPTTRLADIADIKPGPADLLDALGEPLNEGDGIGMAPVAVTAEAHGLPAGAGFCQLRATGETALGIFPVGGGCQCSGLGLGPELEFGRFGQGNPGCEPGAEAQ